MSNYANRRRGFSISAKLTLLTTTSVSLGLLIACAILAVISATNIRSSRIEKIDGLARMLAFNSTAVLTFEDEVAAEQLLESLQAEPDVKSAALTQVDGMVLARYARPGERVRDDDRETRPGSRFRDDGDFEMCLEIEDNAGGKEVVGTLYLKASMEAVDRYMQNFFLIVGLVACVSLAASILLSLVLQRTISGPILDLTGTAKRISHDQDFSIRVERELTDELGELYHAFNAMLDRVEHSESQLRATQEQLKQAKDIAEAASTSKSQFLANMSHEIRTPLTGILGFTEIMLNEKCEAGDDDQTDYLRTISSSGKHLLQLINDILDLSKIEAGQMEVERIACDPHQIMAEVASVLRVKASEKGLDLQIAWESPAPETVQSDPGKVRQILMNLVGNAVKFTESGRVKMVASIIPSQTEPRLSIDIADTGVGIPPDRIDKVFDPFVQADNSVTRKFGGTGLGLAICRRFAEMLGGSLTASSELGVGSVFTLELPTGPLDGVRLRDAPQAEAVSSQEVHDGSKVRLDGARILLADDGATNRKLISLILRRAGCEVVMAEDGLLALRCASETEFDVILMDMQMPEMDGYTATRRLRDRGVTTPIIALTANAMKGDEEKCLTAGCSGYLTKPLDTAKLLRVLAELVGHAAPATSRDHVAAASGVSATADGPLACSLPLDDPIFMEIAAEFVETLRRELWRMRIAVTTGDLAETARLAHWLKGSGGTAGFDAFTESAASLEKAAKEGDAARAARSLTAIEQLADRIQLPCHARA